MEPRFESPERSRSTSELVRHALEQAKLLARAEGTLAGHEVKEELNRGKAAGVALGIAAALAMSGLTLIFAALALVLPLPDWGAALLVALVLLVFAGMAGAVGAKALPKKPMQKTKDRLIDHLTVARERLQ